MKLIKIAAGVLNQIPLDWDGNRDRIIGAIQDARQQEATVLCLPELCITGYGCEDAFHSPGVQELAIQVLHEIVPHTGGLVVCVGLPVFFRGGLFNTACFMADEKIIGFVGKQNLAGEGLHYEPRWFKPWPHGICSEFECNGQTYPIGDLMFEADGLRFGFEICEDAWVANRPGGGLAIEGADILLNPSASHFAFGKNEIRRRFVLDGSRAFNSAYVYANLLGNEAGRAIYDGDAMIASCGKLLASSPRFSFQDYCVTSAIVDVDAIRVGRVRTSSYKPDVDDDEQCIRFDFHFKTHEQLPAQTATGSQGISSDTKEEEFARAIALALFDYMRKSFSRGFIVSLSGGADSAAVATLCALMVRFAHQELGAAEFAKKLRYIDDFQANTPHEIVAKLLTCVYQSTKNSSDTTRNAAKAVAEEIGSQFYELNVDHLVDAYVDVVSDAIERKLTWEHDDLSLQNIQARARGPSVWLLANLTGSLLLATSNRSEAAVGYATMDGDTCGGVSPIAGIDKAFLRKWLEWVEKVGPKGVGPLKSLRLVNVQQPTAELRPQNQHQTDETDLMPYDLLDAIERCAIRDKKTPKEVLLSVEPEFPVYSAKQLAIWIERFFKLWCRNQWKRERYAPSFHVDDENLDPKTWCRFPILSGGYLRELRTMHDFVRSRR